MLLGEAEHRIEGQHHDDDHCVLEFTDETGEDCGNEKDEDEHVAELIREESQ